MNIKTFSIHSVRNVLAVVIALGLGYVAYTVNPTSVVPTKVEAGASDNVSGYAWSENIGWISFNNTSDGAATSYGVNVNTTTGDLSGNAWSENIGWVSFNRADTGTPPATPFNGSSGPIAQVNLSTGSVTGWARVLSQSTAGDGWIKLSDDSIGVWSGKGVKIDPATGKFYGYAWSSDSVGWISFNCATDGSCASSNYLVQGPILTPSCTSNLECAPSGQLCNITTGACVAPGGSCGPGSSCGIGQACNGSNMCVSAGGPCTSDTQCAGGQVCNLTTSTCVAPVGGSCTTSADCVGGQICNTSTNLCQNKPSTKFWQF